MAWNKCKQHDLGLSGLPCTCPRNPKIPDAATSDAKEASDRFTTCAAKPDSYIIASPCRYELGHPGIHSWFAGPPNDLLQNSLKNEDPDDYTIKVPIDTVTKWTLRDVKKAEQRTAFEIISFLYEQGDNHGPDRYHYFRQAADLIREKFLSDKKKP